MPRRAHDALERTQFFVNDAVDKSYVFDDRKVSTGPHMDLQLRIGEPSPAKSMATRHVWISTRGEADDRNLPRRAREELVVIGHPKFRPYDRQHQSR